jgi:hypothetical protein
MGTGTKTGTVASGTGTVVDSPESIAARPVTDGGAGGGGGGEGGGGGGGTGSSGGGGGGGGSEGGAGGAGARDKRPMSPPAGDQPASKRLKQTPQHPPQQQQQQQPPPRCPVVLILVGPPGAGKSTFCGQLPKANWVSVNQDTISKGRRGTRKQCLAAMDRALKSGKHVAVDRCGLSAVGGDRLHCTASCCSNQLDPSA